jgi:hypothetical protein
MAKKKATHRKKGIARSDIPFASRLLANKLETIGQHRDDAALTALKIAAVALNDTEKLGYTRICRFAKRQRELTDEYYSDPEYMEVKLNERLEQMGFKVVSGRLFGAINEDGEIVPTEGLEVGDGNG